MRFRLLPLLFFAVPLAAQAPPSGPLVLRLPTSARAVSLGNAWVVGRDEDVIFYNPAQIAARTGFNLGLARFSETGKQGSLAGAYAAGPLSLAIGWGVQIAHINSEVASAYPFPPDAMTSGGPLTSSSMLAVVGASVLYKGFRIGAAGKYAADERQSFAREGAVLLDAGISRNFLGGLAGFSVQNIGHDSTTGPAPIDIPMQMTLGYALTKNTDQLDISVFGQVTHRPDWTSPGGGVELGYGWIEGWSASIRAGARKPETSAERPFALGATLNADHLTLEYALQFFDGGRHANRMTIRWR